MSIWKIAGLGLLGAALTLIVKRQLPELAMQISLITSIILLLLVVEELSQTVQAVQAFAEQYTGGKPLLRYLLKVVGIAYIGEFTAQLLKDAGQGAVGAKVELAGKLIILSMSVPLLSAFAEAVLQLTA